MRHTRTHKPTSHTHSSRPFFAKGGQSRVSEPFFAQRSALSTVSVQPQRLASQEEQLEDEIQTQPLESTPDNLQQMSAEPPPPPTEPLPPPESGSTTHATIQPKLTICQPHDSYEQEADRVAEQIMRMPEPTLQRQRREEEEEEGSALELIQPQGLAEQVTPRIQSQTAAATTVTNETGDFLRTNFGAGNNMPILQHKCADCAGDKQLELEKIQPKLKISGSNDRYAQEADRVATQVIGSPAPMTAARLSLLGVQPFSSQRWGYSRAKNQLNTSSPPISSIIQRDGDALPPLVEEAAEEAPEEEITCQRSATTEASSEANLETQLQQHRGQGQPLPSATSQFMGARFGYDFSSVRVHTSSAAAQMNQQLNSYAFTTGQDIYFAPGQYQPGSSSGDRLLAHELTHVVQQSTGFKAVAPYIQRRAETKTYYGGLTGNTVHGHVERILRGANGDLITEATIPHATRNRSDVFTDVGFADLYKSEGNKVSGIKGQEEDEETGQRRYNNIGRRTRRRVGGPVSWNPTFVGGAVTGDFPEWFKVADLKPYSLSRLGGGIAQVRHYIEGIPRFADKLQQDLGQTSQIPRGSVLQDSEITLPPAINFDNFDLEHNTDRDLTRAGGIRNGTTNQRIWVYNLSSGLLVYFPVHLGQPSPRFAQWVRQQRTELRALRRELRQRTTPSLNARVDTKRRPTSPVASRPLPQSQQLSKSSAGKPITVQRNGPRTRTDWAARGRRWESHRRPWSRRVKTYFRDRGRSLRDYVHISDELNRPARIGPGELANGGPIVEEILFWSGPFGKFFGALRFRFGRIFDLVAEKFDRIRDRFRGFNHRVRRLAGRSYSFGWRRQLIRVLMRAVKAGIVRFLQESYNIFANCATALMQKAIQQIVDHASEDYKEEICTVETAFDDWKDQIETELQERFGDYEEVIDQLGDVQQWISLTTSLITLIRLGFQAVACLSPPALGCLWGLVGQVALEVMLDLIIGTEWFQQNIIGSDIVRDLMLEFVGPTYQQLMTAAIDSAGLTELAADVQPCHFSETSPSNFINTSGGLSGSALAAHRANWMRQHDARFLRLLQQVFESENGRQPTAEELRQLIETMRTSRLSDDQLRDLLRRSRNNGGRIALTQVLDQLRAPAASSRPESEPEEQSETPSESTEPEAATGSGSVDSPGTTSAEEADEEGTGVSRSVHSPQPVPPDFSPGETMRISNFLIIDGIDPATRYTATQRPEITFEFWYQGNLHVIQAVPVVVLAQRNRRGRIFTRFQLRFENSFYVRAIDLQFLGGEGQEFWYTFER